MAISKVVSSGRGSGGNIVKSLVVASGDVIVALCTSQDSNTNNIGCASITRDGQSFTKRGGAGGSGGAGAPNYSECWYLEAPNVGTADATAVFNGSINECTATFFVLTGAQATSFFDGTDDSDSTNGVPPSMALTTTADDSLLIGALTSEGDITAVGAGQDTDADLTGQSFENTVVSSKQGGTAGAKTFSFTAPSNQYAQYLVAIKAAVLTYTSPFPSHRNV